MADNTTLPGTGEVIGTDDVSGVKYQQVKLMDGTLNSAAVIPGDATNGLDVDVTRVSGNVTVVQGTATNLKVDASGVAVPITDNSGSLTVDQATAANLNATVVQATAASLNATVVQGTASNLKVEPNGSVAHDGADSGNPLKMGGRARSSDITAVSSDDRTDFLTDLTGKHVVRNHCIPEQQLSGVNSATGTGDTAVIAAQGAGVRIYVTAISVCNSSTTNAIIEIKDATTVIWRCAAPGGGGSNGLNFDPPLRLTANAALNMASLTGVTTAYFSANGYKGV